MNIRKKKRVRSYLQRDLNMRVSQYTPHDIPCYLPRVHSFFGAISNACYMYLHTHTHTHSYFPHLLNAEGYEHTELPHLPDARYYDAGRMSTSKFLEFRKWYMDNKQMPFNLQTELRRYCDLVSICAYTCMRV